MNSGVLDLKMRRKVSFAPAAAGIDAGSGAGRRAAAAAGTIQGPDAKHENRHSREQNGVQKGHFHRVC